MKLDGVSAAALIALAAFAIDRVVTAALFVFVYFGILSDSASKKGEEQFATDRTYKIVYFIASLALVIVVLAIVPGIRILAAMGLRTDSPLLDELLTGIVLLGGTERLSEWMKTEGTTGEPTPAEPPIRVTGSLTLDDKRS
jgi:hypothetical protein